MCFCAKYYGMASNQPGCFSDEGRDYLMDCVLGPDACTAASSTWPTHLALSSANIVYALVVLLASSRLFHANVQAKGLKWNPPTITHLFCILNSIFSMVWSAGYVFTGLTQSLKVATVMLYVVGVPLSAATTFSAGFTISLAWLDMQDG